MNIVGPIEYHNIVNSLKTSDKRNRTCYRCGKLLNISDFLCSNYSIKMKLTVDDLINIWENENVELLCCACIRDIELEYMWNRDKQEWEIDIEKLRKYSNRNYNV